MLCFGIGFSQILDHYAKTSLEAQKLWKFPGSLALSLKSLKESLEKPFSWSSEPLDLSSGIGTPAIQIGYIKDGMFIQKLTEKVKRSTAIHLNICQEEDYGHEEMHLTADDIQDQEMHLSSGITPERLSEVEQSLAVSVVML